MPEFTGNITGLGTTRILEAIRRSGIKVKFYQASSSEMFGDALPPQNEKTPFKPRSPYAAAKVYAYWMTVNYRDGYNMFACNGILFNHESPRRGETFVTRKISRAIAQIIAGKQKRLYLGNLETKRDWGFTPEYVICQWLMLQQDRPDDYVIGTGKSHSVREFVESAFSYAGIEIEWKGEGVNQVGIIKSLRPHLTSLDSHIKVGDTLIEIDPKYFRPTDVNILQADIVKAKEKLGWEPKVTFEELIKIMVDSDMELIGINTNSDGKKILEKKGISWTRNNLAVNHIQN